MKKTLFTVLTIALACALVLSGCAAGNPTPASSAPAAASQSPAAASSAAAPATSAAVSASQSAQATVTDMLGNQVTIQSTDKIVSLAPSATEVLYALGVGDRIIGVDSYSDYPAEAKTKTVVGDFNGPSVEKIVSLKPDIVFCGNTLQKDQIAQMQKLGLTVVATEAVSFDDIPKSIELMGTIFGKQAEAKVVVDKINQAMADAKQKAPKEAKTVYYAMTFGDAGNWTSGPGSFINTMIEIAGGVPITKDAEMPWLEYPLEKLASQNPDIILFSSDMGSKDDISKAQGYKDLSAVKNGNVFQLESNVVSRPGPRIADAIALISEIINK